MAAGLVSVANHGSISSQAKNRFFTSVFAKPLPALSEKGSVPNDNSNPLMRIKLERLTSFFIWRKNV
jgi:hypothetical protein